MASKTIKEQIAEALAPVKAELEAKRKIIKDIAASFDCDEGEVASVAEKFGGEMADAMVDLAHARERIAELEAELATWQEANRKCSAEFMELNERLHADVERLQAELSEARGIIAHQAGEVSAARREIGDGVDLSAAIYRDALADFAIRVLSGGVAVSFHEARP